MRSYTVCLLFFIFWASILKVIRWKEKEFIDHCKVFFESIFQSMSIENCNLVLGL